MERCSGTDSSFQSSRLRSTVSGDSGSGISSPQPCAANSDRRPLRTASARPGSGKDAKNCHGVLAAHSSPMKIIGVYGEQSTMAAPQASRPGRTEADSRSPWARLPIWSWSCR